MDRVRSNLRRKSSGTSFERAGSFPAAFQGMGRRRHSGPSALQVFRDENDLDDLSLTQDLQRQVTASCAAVLTSHTAKKQGLSFELESSSINARVEARVEVEGDFNSLLEQLRNEYDRVVQELGRSEARVPDSNPSVRKSKRSYTVPDSPRGVSQKRTSSKQRAASKPEVPVYSCTDSGKRVRQHSSFSDPIVLPNGNNNHDPSMAQHVDDDDIRGSSFGSSEGVNVPDLSRAQTCPDDLILAGEDQAKHDSRPIETGSTATDSIDLEDKESTQNSLPVVAVKSSSQEMKTVTIADTPHPPDDDPPTMTKLNQEREESYASFGEVVSLVGTSDPENEETTFEIHPVWRKSRRTLFDKVAKPTRISLSRNHLDLQNKHNYNGILAPFIGLPSAPQRVALDVVGAVLILYDLITVPLRVFDPPDTVFSNTMDIFSLVFWTMSIPIALTTAYLNEGVYEMNPKAICSHYFKGWFWIDMAVIVPDWSFMFAKLVMQGSNDTASGSVRLLRILRLSRSMRLLRLAKLKWIVAAVKDLIDSEFLDILFNILKMILSLLAVNHYLACGWFALTLLEQSRSWISVYHFSSEDWTYQYVSAFHWAITQFTPASMHVQPENMYERCYAIAVVVAGLVGFAYLCGSITGSLTELRKLNEEGAKQFWNVRRFLKKNMVPMVLRIKIEKYLEHAWMLHKGSNTEKNLPILHLLTQQLKDELNLAIHMPHLRCHPLFEFLNDRYNDSMQRIATRALSRKLFARGETIFLPHELAQHMDFVVAGNLRYTRTCEATHSEIVEWVTMGEDWITEPAVWTEEWITLGELIAACVTEMLEVSQKEFAEAIKRTPHVFAVVSAYASNFMKRLNSIDHDNLSDIIQGDKVRNEIADLICPDSASDMKFAPTRSLKMNSGSTASFSEQNIGVVAGGQ